MDDTRWIECDSRSDLETRIKFLENRIFEFLVCEEPNTWGYLQSNSENFIVPIGYCNIGLQPSFHENDGSLFIGISEVLACYSTGLGTVSFKYRMPTVFHDFILSDSEHLIIQDEISFISLSHNGEENWVEPLPDTIEKYEVKGDYISGQTSQGQDFNFSINR